MKVTEMQVTFIGNHSVTRLLYKLKKAYPYNSFFLNYSNSDETAITVISRRENSEDVFHILQYIKGYLI